MRQGLNSPPNKGALTTMNISVIVVSHKRPAWLARCLRALGQLDYPGFEIVVVADSESLSKCDCSGIKRIAFDQANISAARNLGVRQAAGEICAFIDDDAVPEPLWLRHLADAFTTTGADAVVGFVRGRNGIGFQSKVASVDVEAETHAEPDQGEMPYVPKLKPGRALKLVGTNMSFRRDTLVALNGFDEAYAYFLDDTDISLRLAKAGMTAAVAPLAEIHHGFAPSSRRAATRAPTDLFDIGRSSAIYFRRHGAADLKDLQTRITLRERKRLLRHMVAGNCEPRHIALRLATLSRGWAAGMDADLPGIARNLKCQADFSPVPPPDGENMVLSSRLLHRRSTLKKAAELSSKGHRVSVFSFSLTPVRHHVRYTDDGVWVQTGGQFGRTKRESKRFKWCRFANRRKEEIERVAKVRGI